MRFNMDWKFALSAILIAVLIISFISIDGMLPEGKLIAKYGIPSKNVATPPTYASSSKGGTVVAKAPPPGNIPFPISSCTTINESNKNYAIVNDLHTNPNSVCMNIVNASDLKIRCNNHIFYGANNATTFSVINSTNIILEKCIILDSDLAIMIKNSTVLLNDSYVVNNEDGIIAKDSTVYLLNGMLKNGTTFLELENSHAEIDTTKTNIGVLYADMNDVSFSDGGNMTPPQGYAVVNSPISFTNTSNNGWVEFEVDYNDSDWQSTLITNESTIGLWKFNGSWDMLNSTDIVGNNIYAGNISSFSTFSILGSKNITSCVNLTANGGHYVLTQNLSGTQPGRDVCIDVQADNVVLDCDGYTIDGGSAANPFYGISVRDHSNITIKNCDVRNYDDFSISLYNGSDFVIEKNNISNSGGDAIVISFADNVKIINNFMKDTTSRAVDVTSTNNLTVEDNYIYSADRGVFISRQNTNNFVIRNNIINSTSTGLQVYYAEGMLMDNNTILNGGTAIELLHTKYTKVYNNYIKNMSDFGIFVRTTPFQGSFNITLVNNTIIGVSPVGAPIYLEDLGNVSVMGGTLSNGYNTGIFLYNCKNVNFTSLDISNIVGYGVYVEKGYDVTFDSLSRSNVSEEFLYILTSKDIEASNLNLSGGTAIYSSDSERVSVHDSMFNNSRVRFLNTPSFEVYNSNIIGGTSYGVEVYSSDNGAITNNTFYNGDDGVYTSNSDDTIVEKNIFDSVGTGIRILNGGTRNVIRDNTFSNSHVWGVAIYSSSLNEIYSNTFIDNFQDVYISGSNNSIYDNTMSGFNLLSIYPYGDDNYIANNTIVGDALSGYGINIIGDRNIVSGGEISNCNIGVRFVGSACENNTIEGTYIHHNNYGVYLLSYAKGTTINNSNVTDNYVYDIYMEHDTNITLVNVTTNGTQYSLRGDSVSIRAAVPQEEVDDAYVDLHKYLMITNTSSSSWVELNISYTDDEVRQYNIDESTIRLWRFNGSWLPPEKAAEVNMVNTKENYVYSKIDMFSIFTLVGRRVEAVTPRVSTTSIEPPLVCADDVAYYYFHRVYPNETKEAEKTFCNDLRVSSIATDSDVFQAKIIIENMESTTKVPNVPYKYFKVRVINPEGISKVEFELRVNKSWINKNGIAPTTVKLYYYDNGWNELKTKLVYDDENYYYYKAESDVIANIAASGMVGVDFWNVFESIQRYYMDELDFSEVIHTISLYYSSNQ